MKYIYIPQTLTGLVGISYIGTLLRILLHVSLISISHNRTSNYQLQVRANEQFFHVSVINASHSSRSGNQLH
jgi:hypothetical protein